MDDRGKPRVTHDSALSSVYEFAADLAWAVNEPVWIAEDVHVLLLVAIPDVFEIEARANCWDDLPPTTMLLRGDGRSVKFFRCPAGIQPDDLADGTNIVLMPEGVRL